MHHILENLGRHANRLTRRDEEESVADIDGIEAHFYGETDLADQVARVSANYTAADAMMGWAPQIGRTKRGRSNLRVQHPAPASHIRYRDLTNAMISKPDQGDLQ